MARHGAYVSLLALLWCACSARPALTIGSECELTTQCAAPLVCRLGYCRDECRVNRDCRAGLVCLRDDRGLGACSLPDQDTCTHNSDCMLPLVCIMGRCSEACMSDVDCPAGARCATDPSGTGTGCVDPSTMDCDYNSDCGDPYICTPDHQCREQCHTDRDCRDGTVCDRSASPTICVPASAIDAGMDAGPSDGGDDTGTDAGLDAGTSPGTDTGLDAGLDAFALATDTGMDASVTTGPATMPLLVAGSDHACATRGSELRCWGAGTSGQIGDGNAMNRFTATLVAPQPAAVTLLAAGVGHSCALATGGLSCWGDATSGQLGDGVHAARSVPGPVTGGLAPTWIAAGHAHTCAVVGGAVQCWGANASGQIGDGTQMQRPTPTATLPLSAAAAEVDARGDWSCARLVDGRAQCWGDDSSGQLGVNLPTNLSATPLVVAGVTGAVEVALGISHGCYRRLDGTVYCWGRGSNGQLGDGSSGGGVIRLTPGPTAAMPPAEELAAGGDHTCARTTSGDVYCWGFNFGGECGQDGFAMPVVSRPALVAGVSGALELAAGDAFTCARVAAGIVCWGDNPSGQLGDASAGHFAPGAVTWL